MIATTTDGYESQYTVLLSERPQQHGYSTPEQGVEDCIEKNKDVASKYINLQIW